MLLYRLNHKVGTNFRSKDFRSKVLRKFDKTSPPTPPHRSQLLALQGVPNAVDLGGVGWGGKGVLKPKLKKKKPAVDTTLVQSMGPAYFVLGQVH